MFKSKKKGERAILIVGNKHAPGCGKTPEVDVTGSYVSYYENSFGEQWVFVGNRSDGSIDLYGGDIGWDEPRRATAVKPYPCIMMGHSEQVWYVACLMACFDLLYNDAFGRYRSHVEEHRKALMEKHT
jgi:hypothetical protein